jgi:adenylate cyclase
VRKTTVGTLIGAAAALGAGLIALIPFFQTVEFKTYDWRVRHTVDPSTARQDIVLIRIDDLSIRKLEPAVGRWPWPRLVHANLLDYLSRAPARVILYDVLFAERDRRSFKVGDENWTGQESDNALVEATRRAGNVVHVADVTVEASQEVRQSAQPAPDLLGARYAFQQGFEERPSILPPFEDLARASRAIGHNLLVLDPDGPVRRVVPFVRVGGADVPSLPMAAVMLILGVRPADVRVDEGQLRLAARTVPLVEQEIPSFYGENRHARRMLISFSGPVLFKGRTTYAEYSFYDLFYSQQQLLAGEKPYVDPAVFKDKIVVVGTAAPGLSDVFTVPLASGPMPGAQIHANVIDDVLSSRFVGPAPRWAAAAALLLPALVVAVASMFAGLWMTVAATIAMIAVLLWGSLLLFARGIWLPITGPGLAVALASFGGVAHQYLVEGREKRKVKRLFSRFVSRDVYEQLLADPARARLGGQRRNMTVLFADIRGFTPFSESGQPEDVVMQLNQYFSCMVRVLFDHRGTLDKFVGDMVMALFGAPLDDEGHAEHAVEAALAMRRELDSLNREWEAQGRPRLDIGIGINTGEMIAGNIGSEAIMSYTVIGDAVNLGSRLEALNKEYGTHILISEATRASLKRRYDIHPLGQVVVKGKTRPVAIFEVCGSEPAGPDVAGGVGPGIQGGVGS